MGTKPAKINGIDATPKKLGVLLGAFNAKNDARLIELINQWPGLPEAVREAIVTVAKAAVK